MDRSLTTRLSEILAEIEDDLGEQCRFCRSFLWAEYRVEAYEEDPKELPDQGTYSTGYVSFIQDKIKIYKRRRKITIVTKTCHTCNEVDSWRIMGDWEKYLYKEIHPNSASSSSNITITTGTSTGNNTYGLIMKHGSQ